MSAPPDPPSPQEPELLFCHECRMAVELQDLPPVPLSSLPRLCPFCSRGFLDEDPPSPPPSPPPLPAPPSPPTQACPCCGCLGVVVPLDDGSTTPSASPPTPPPPPPPPPFPGSGSGTSSSELSDDPDAGGDALLGTDHDSAHELFRYFAARSRGVGGGGGPLVADFAAAAAFSALRDGPHRAAGAAFDTILHRPPGLPLGPNPAYLMGMAAGGEPPAQAASIAALPMVEVAEPAAACAICKDDLPLASQAMRLPCAHLYHSACIVTWLELHNSCPVCRSSIPSANAAPAAGAPEGATVPSEEDSQTTRITIRFTTTTSTTRRRRGRLHGGAAAVAGPVSASPTQLAQAVNGDGAGGPANSGETVSSEWPRQPDSDAVMSEAREEDGFFD